MAIETKLSICIENCSSLLIYDNTLEESDTNETGWGNNNVINPNLLTSAEIEITSPDLSVDTIVLNTSNLPSSVSSKFLLTTFTLSGDGKYKIKYTVTYYLDELDPTSFVTLVTSTEIYNLCSLRCCVDKMWTTVYDISSCGCSDRYEQVINAEALYKAIANATGSINDAVRDKLIKKLKRICNLENCNCN